MQPRNCNNVKIGLAKRYNKQELNNMADSILKNVFAPSGMVEPPKKLLTEAKLPAPEIEKIKGLGIVANPVVRVPEK
jgi:hypothetical protein